MCPCRSGPSYKRKAGASSHHEALDLTDYLLEEVYDEGYDLLDSRDILEKVPDDAKEILKEIYDNGEDIFENVCYDAKVQFLMIVKTYLKKFLMIHI